MDLGDGYPAQNDLLGNLVDNFNLNELDVDVFDVELDQQVLNIENPNRVVLTTRT